MSNNLKSWYILGMILGLAIVLGVTVNISNNEKNDALAQVEISGSSPSIIPNPSITTGQKVAITIAADPVTADNNGTQTRVYDPIAAASVSFVGGCPLPSPAVGKAWELRADTDGDTDFSDAGSVAVRYFLDNPGPPASQILILHFPRSAAGPGQLVTIVPSSGATKTPDTPAGGYSWQRVGASGVGTNDANINVLGRYLIASCGKEGPNVLDFVQTAQFIVKGNTTTTTMSSKTGTVAPGTSVTDSATVTGQVPLPRPQVNGTVSFFLCGPTISVTPCTAGGTPSGVIPIPTPNAGSATVTSLPQAPVTEGFYCWRAVYNAPADRTPPATPELYAKSNSTVTTNECFQVRGPGKIIIIKDTLPNGPQDFKFTHNIPSTPAVASPFFLDDDFSPPLSNTQTFDKVPPGSYTVTEMTVPAIPLQSIRCVDPDGGSVRAGNSANIDLDAGEIVTCTFVNGVEQPPCGEGLLSVPQPEDAISMTSIRSGSMVKTIHAEKQIFDCELSPDGIPVIADVTIIAEIYQDLNTKSVISKQVEVVTCLKDPATIKVLECKLSIPSQDRIPVTNCSENIDNTHPQEMNTIRKGGTAKTIETQKEVFICTFADGPDRPESENPNDKKVDLVIFTDIFQNLNTQTLEDLQILSMKCVIKIDNVTVESCRFTNHPV